MLVLALNAAARAKTAAAAGGVAEQRCAPRAAQPRRGGRPAQEDGFHLADRILATEQAIQLDESSMVNGQPPRRRELEADPRRAFTRGPVRTLKARRGRRARRLQPNGRVQAAGFLVLLEQAMPSAGSYCAGGAHGIEPIIDCS